MQNFALRALEHLRKLPGSPSGRASAAVIGEPPLACCSSVIGEGHAEGHAVIGDCRKSLHHPVVSPCCTASASRRSAAAR